MGGCFLGVFECAGIFVRGGAFCPNIVGGKYFRNSFVWNIVSINALWVWWKCEVAYFTICKYDFKDILVIYYSYYIAFFPCPWHRKHIVHYKWHWHLILGPLYSCRQPITHGFFFSFCWLLPNFSTCEYDGAYGQAISCTMLAMVNKNTTHKT